MGVPILLGAGGVEKVIEVELTAEEKANLAQSAQAVRELMDVLPSADELRAAN